MGLAVESEDPDAPKLSSLAPWIWFFYVTNNLKVI